MSAQLAMGISVDLPAEERRCPLCEWGWGDPGYDAPGYQALCFHSGACPQVEGVGADVEAERARTCAFWMPSWLVRMTAAARRGGPTLTV